MIELRKRGYSAPWALPTEGSLGDVLNITAEAIQSHYDSYFSPNGVILGVAGHVDPAEIESVVRECFSDWEAKPKSQIELREMPEMPSHLRHNSTQTHIGISYPSVPFKHEKYYDAWAAVSVLSGGMSSRLFTKVREERGLCYSIGASLVGFPDEGRVRCYAGTTAERAQETLDVTLEELENLKNGIEERELERCKVRAKSSLIMQQESTISRAGSIARDWFHLGRINTLVDIRKKVDTVTVDSVLKYVHDFPAHDFTILTLGPNALEQTSEFS